MSFPTSWEKLDPKAVPHSAVATSWLPACSVWLRVKAWIWNMHREQSGRSVAAAMFFWDCANNRELPAFAHSDVTWIDLFPRRWQDANQQESAAVGPWLDQIRTAGCGVLCTAVTHIKQSGVPIRYEGAAGHSETGGGEWLKASLLHFSCVSAAPLTSGLVYILYCACLCVWWWVGM